MATQKSSRRGLLKAGLAGGAVGAISSCEPCGGLSGPAIHTGQRVRWRLASSFPGSLDTIFGSATHLSETVSAMTEGNFTIEVYEAGELVPGLQVLDAAQKGSCEVGHTAGYYYVGKDPALAFDTCMPFGLSSRQQTAWLYEGGGLELVREVYADFSVISFPCGNTGAQMGGWFRKPMRSAADLKGLKMRIPGLGGRVMDALGVNVQNIAGGDIYPALERGVIDATDWVGPYDDEMLGFYQVAKIYHYPGWWEPGPSLSFVVNQDAWASLSKSYQAVFEAASRGAALAMQAAYDAKNPPALKRLVAHGVQLTRFPEDLMSAAREASQQLLSDQAAADPRSARILQNWEKFRSGAFEWFGTAERAYMESMGPG
jgi:TRAP-type mannitol/chloroaromatic compound transport system substrate-binding protein